MLYHNLMRKYVNRTEISLIHDWKVNMEQEQIWNWFWCFFLLDIYCYYNSPVNSRFPFCGATSELLEGWRDKWDPFTGLSVLHGLVTEACQVFLCNSQTHDIKMHGIATKVTSKSHAVLTCAWFNIPSFQDQNLVIAPGSSSLLWFRKVIYCHFLKSNKECVINAVNSQRQSLNDCMTLMSL